MPNLVQITNKLKPVEIHSYIPEPVSPTFFDHFNLQSNKKQFLELINLGLNKSTLNQVLNSVERGRSLGQIHPESTEANIYLAKILREEIQKQFSEEDRPLVELILNGVDARPKAYEGIYVVDVQVSKNRFQVTDNGKGMGLQRILDTLIIPFSSDKNELVDIGRFGIGFFSDLQYCLEKPKKGTVTIDTSDESSSYQLKVHSKGKNVENLVCSLRKTRSKVEGTTVQVTGIDVDTEKTTEYLTRYLNFFDPRRAVIRVNGTPINLIRKQSPAYAEYLIPTQLEHRGQPIEQDIRVAIDVLSNREDSHINLYSQGIFIQRYALKYGRVDIDFPSSVLLVEGRDELKRDGSYLKCLSESLKAVVQYGEDNKDNPWVLMNLRELLPSFIQRLKKGNKDIGKEIARVCFPKKTYFVNDPDGLGMTVSLKDFFGEDVIDQIYVPKTNTAYHAWKNILPDVHQLVGDNVTQRTHLRDKTYFEKKMDQKLGRQLANHGEVEWNDTLYLVSLNKPTETKSPVLCTNGDTYVNVDHPFMQSAGYTQKYGLRTAMARERYGGEKAAEDRFVR